MEQLLVVYNIYPQDVKDNLIISMKSCDPTIVRVEVKLCCNEFQIFFEEEKCDIIQTTIPTTIPTTIQTKPSPSPLPSALGLSKGTLIEIIILFVIILIVASYICIWRF